MILIFSICTFIYTMKRSIIDNHIQNSYASYAIDIPTTTQYYLHTYIIINYCHHQKQQKQQQVTDANLSPVNAPTFRRQHRQGETVASVLLRYRSLSTTGSFCPRNRNPTRLHIDKRSKAHSRVRILKLK